MTRIYKITTRAAWAEAERSGAFTGAAIDLKDGYIHLSTALQAAETARLHFKGQQGLILVGFEAESFGEQLRWEPSRGGQLFPHVYGVLPTDAAVCVLEASLGPDGVPVVPALEP